MTIYNTVPEDAEGFDPDYVVTTDEPGDIEEHEDIPEELSEDNG